MASTIGSISRVPLPASAPVQKIITVIHVTLTEVTDGQVSITVLVSLSPDIPG